VHGSPFFKTSLFNTKNFFKMGRSNKGILSDFSGKVGTVVGSSWKGINYMRSLPKFKKNRKVSEAQQGQQLKFTMASDFIGAFSPLFNTSYQRSEKKTGRNAALSNVIAMAIVGDYPNFSIDYSKVVIAKGSLKKGDNPTASSVSAGKLLFTWADNSGMGTATEGDKAILVAYCPETNDAIFTVSGPNRLAATAELDMPFFSGKRVHTWIAFRSPDGKLTANSVYTGEVQVL
jgi:hypothetical protein